MSKADEAFRKIKYEKIEDPKILKYENINKNKRIYFIEKTVRYSYYNVSGEYPAYLDMQELKAIYLKCKEKGVGIMKYTEEEKKAIKILANDNWEYLNYTDNEKEYNDLKKSIEIVVNLAKKQQKEIEKCKVAFNAQVEALIKMTNIYNNLYDKIKEIEENGYWDFLEKRDYEKTIKILKELLGDE